MTPEERMRLYELHYIYHTTITNLIKDLLDKCSTSEQKQVLLEKINISNSAYQKRIKEQ